MKNVRQKDWKMKDRRLRRKLVIHQHLNLLKRTLLRMNNLRKSLILQKSKEIEIKGRKRSRNKGGPNKRR